MLFEYRIRINVAKACSRFNNASIGSHHVSWRVLGATQLRDHRWNDPDVHGSYGKLYRGYYTVARRYEFYTRVAARTITSHSFAALTREMLSLPREHKIYIFELKCNVYINILMTAFLMIFRRFPTTFREFPKIFQNCSEGPTKVLEHFPII